MGVRSAGALFLLLLTVGCGGAGGVTSLNSLNITTPDSTWSTFLDQATVVFPAHTFSAATLVTLREDPPPHITDPAFHAIERTLTLSAPAHANAFDVYYPKQTGYTQFEAVALNGSQTVATLPTVVQDGQISIHVDPALIPPGTGSLQVTICLGYVSN